MGGCCCVFVSTDSELAMDTHGSSSEARTSIPPALRILAPWMLYLLVFAVTTAVGVVCIKYFLADDMLAAVFAAATLGFIVAACMCFWSSLRASAENANTLSRRSNKKILVTVKTHVYVAGEPAFGDVKNDQPILCPICLIDFEEGAPVVALDCHHLFHLDCISTWVKRKAQCPACRFALPTTSVSGRSTPAVVVEPQTV